MFAGQRDGLGSGPGLSDHRHVRLPVNDAEEAETYHRMIVRNQYSDDAGISALSIRRGLQSGLHGRKELYTMKPGTCYVRSKRLGSLYLLVLASLAQGASKESANADLEPSQYVSRVWRTQDGLPESRIRAIAQTPNGYLWVGTPGGLARFD